VKAHAGELEGPIGRHPKERKRMAVVPGGRFARTRYEVVEKRRAFLRSPRSRGEPLRGSSEFVGIYTLVRCDLETGRTHQIRVHLAALGHPIAGDVEYGGRRPGEPGRPMLHAWRLRLRHPRTGAQMSFEAPPPEDFTSYWATLQ
jgi:23S rRNA pseudouridine1911/1915/1917 synthase